MDTRTPAATVFRLFTKESLVKIERRIAEEQAAKESNHDKDHHGDDQHEDDKHGGESDENKPTPNPALEIGKTLPTKYGEFPPELVGKPIEDIDEYYANKYSFLVIARDRSIFRFTATKAFFVLSPFNPIRRAAIYVLTHPAFSLFVMVVILVNCVFMAINKDIKHSELIFTIIYTIEGSIKMTARGFILNDFTYLRDAWNWLDFTVVTLA